MDDKASEKLSGPLGLESHVQWYKVQIAVGFSGNSEGKLLG